MCKDSLMGYGSAMIHNKSQNAKAKALCNKPCQLMGHPRRTCAWEEEAAGHIGSRLTLPKLDLATFNLTIKKQHCEKFWFSFHFKVARMQSHTV